MRIDPLNTTNNHHVTFPWAVYCDRPTQLYLKGRGKKIVAHFPEASAWGVFVRRLRRRFRPEEFFWPEIYCEGPLYEYEYEYGYEYWFTDY